MGTASEEIAKARRGQGCLGKADPDEPVFILRAQDLLSDRLVDDWANGAEVNGCSPEKVAEARELATRMRRWPTRKYPD